MTISKNNSIKKIFLTILTSLCFFICLTAEPVQDDYFGFSLDIPEGYKLDSQTEDGLSLLFKHPNIPVELVIKIYQPDITTTSEKILSEALGKLSGKADIANLVWSEKNCSVASISFTLDKKYTGWATSTPTKYNNGYLVLLCYAPQALENQCQQFIISTINSLCIDSDFYNIPGIITTYAYPKEKNKEIVLKIDNTNIKTTIDINDEEASQFVVDLEYSVLLLYKKHNLWKEAWQRYYRQIYRDSYGRLENTGINIYNQLYKKAKAKNNKNPEIVYSQYLLSWVQNFEYERAENIRQSDFTNLTSAICGKGNDCDSRSLLLCVLLKSIGIDSIFLFSPEYAHAMAGIGIEAPGQIYTLPSDGRNFLLGETTAKVTWGTIAQEHSDRSKWIPVLF